MNRIDANPIAEPTFSTAIIELKGRVRLETSPHIASFVCKVLDSVCNSIDGATQYDQHRRADEKALEPDHVPVLVIDSSKKQGGKFRSGGAGSWVAQTNFTKLTSAYLTACAAFF